MVRFGRRLVRDSSPFSGRYLTRLCLMAGICICAMVILNWEHYGRGSARGHRTNSSGPHPVLQTAIAPSPFGELGVGVIVAEDNPKDAEPTPKGGSDPATRDESPADGLPPVDMALLQDVVHKVRRLKPAPYYHLLTIAARSSLQLLEQHTRKDVIWAHLWSDPDQYRGELIFLKGHLRGLKKFEAERDRRLNPAGIKFLYQGDLFTEESHPNPYVILVPNLAEGMPLGSNLMENVTFAGYFLQLWRYTAAGDVERAAPLLIGRILVWTPAPRPVQSSQFSAYLAIAFVLLGICMGGAVWAINLRGSRRQPSDGPPDERAEAAAKAGLAELEKLNMPDPFQPPTG